MASNLDDMETWPLGEITFQDRGGSASLSESAYWNFATEGSPDPASSTLGLNSFRQESDAGSDIFGKSLFSCKADRAAASKSLEELMHLDQRMSTVATSGSEDSSSTNILRKRSINSDTSRSSSKKSSLRQRSLAIDEFQAAISSSKSLGSFGSSSSSAESSYEILSSVSPPLPRNLSLLTDEQRATLQSIVASRRQFLSKSRKSNLEKLYGQNLNSEEEMLSHVIRTYISKIPRDHSRLQLDQSTQALRHFIEMQLCIPFENFLITDAKLPGIECCLSCGSYMCRLLCALILNCHLTLRRSSNRSCNCRISAFDWLHSPGNVGSQLQLHSRPKYTY
jgi:hypothetical protein